MEPPKRPNIIHILSDLGENTETTHVGETVPQLAAMEKPKIQITLSEARWLLSDSTVLEKM